MEGNAHRSGHGGPGRLIVFSGAGLSAGSGIQTFRGAGGMWNGADVREVCSLPTWKRNFDRVHEFYNARRVELGSVAPNAAHRKVAEWQGRYDTELYTQNVDDLLERAGCRDVIHLHGYLTEMRCTDCGGVWDLGYRAWKPGERCPVGRRCHAWGGIKPNVVFFGEAAPRYADLNRMLDGLTERDVVLVVGTSCQVVPMHAYLSDRPCYRILNNLEPSRSLDVDVGSLFDRAIYAPASEAVEEIDALLRDRLPSRAAA